MKAMDKVVAEIRARGESLSSFASRIGVKSQDINNWKRRGIPRSKQKRVADALGWSMDRLLRDDYRYGDEPWLMDEARQPSAKRRLHQVRESAEDALNKHRKCLEAEPETDIWVPQRRIAWVDDRVVVLPEATAPLGFSRSWLAAAGLSEDAAALCGVLDDSMLPLFRVGDLLLVDLGDRCAVDGATFVASTQGALAIRRLFISYEGTWVLRAGDPVRYPDQLVPPQDQGTRLRLVGRVRWHGGLMA
jgi:lambda repressor-like predicted transcriptional regulator